MSLQEQSDQELAYQLIQEYVSTGTISLQEDVTVFGYEEFGAWWAESESFPNRVDHDATAEGQDYISNIDLTSDRALTDISTYVANNAYVNGVPLGNVVPELEIYMVENIDNTATNIVSMFGLEHHEVLQDMEGEVDLTFTLDASVIENTMNDYFG